MNTPPSAPGARPLLSSLFRHRTLDLYIGRRFAGIFLADLFVFTLVYVIIDSLGQINQFLENSRSFWSLLKVVIVFYYHELPGLFCRILGPVVTMASAMFTVTLTARANEFIPVLATGTSLRRVLAPILVLGTLVSGCTLYLQEHWIPNHRQGIQEARTLGRHRSEIRHAHYTDRAQGVVIIAKRYLPSDQRAEGILIFSTSKNRDRSFIINAGAARWEQPGNRPGYWVLEEGELQEYGADGRLIPKSAPPPETSQPGPPGTPPAAPPDPPPPAGDQKPRKKGGQPPPAPATRLSESFQARRLDEMVHTPLIPQDLEDDGSQDMFLTRADLRRKIERAPEDRARWLIKLHARYVDPLHHLVLLFLGIPVVLFRNTRNVFLSALVAVVLSTGYFVTHAICMYLGNRGTLDPVTAAWLAPIGFGSLGLTLYVFIRT